MYVTTILYRVYCVSSAELLSTALRSKSEDKFCKRAGETVYFESPLNVHLLREKCEVTWNYVSENWRLLLISLVIRSDRSFATLFTLIVNMGTGDLGLRIFIRHYVWRNAVEMCVLV